MKQEVKEVFLGFIRIVCYLYSGVVGLFIGFGPLWLVAYLGVKISSWFWLAFPLSLPFIGLGMLWISKSADIILNDEKDEDCLSKEDEEP